MWGSPGLGLLFALLFGASDYPIGRTLRSLQVAAAYFFRFLVDRFVESLGVTRDFLIPRGEYKQDDSFHMG